LEDIAVGSVTNEMLVKTYLELKSVKLTAKKLRLVPNYASRRIKMIREAGVQLPKFTNQKNKMVIDVNSLNNMVKDHGHSVVTKKTKKS
jgi:hypothetical protein